MPLLSVVVPTHNRSDYAISCIEATLAHDDRDLQLVVCDTSSDGRLADRLHKDGRSFLADPRLIYRKIDGLSNQTQNHNDAMALATGDYVCVIGDDDCITAAAIDAARWAGANGVDLVSQTISANYVWPDFQARFTGRSHAARLYVPRAIGPSKWHKSDEALSAALARAFQGTERLPRGYHGVVRRAVMEECRARTGAYFHGSSPDMSAAVSMACLIDRFLEVETPLSIPGASSGSNSGRSAMNTHKGTLAAETQTRAFETSGWSVGVPRFFAVETVWAHAGLEALKRLRPERVREFDYVKLIALCKFHHPEFDDAANAAIAEAEAIVDRPLGSAVKRQVARERWARRHYLFGRALRPTAAGGRRYLGGIATVADASRRYEDYARGHGFAFASAVLGV